MIVFSCASALAACAASATNVTTGTGGNGGAASSSQSGAGAGPSSGSTGGSMNFTTSATGSGGSAPLAFLAYAHTGKTLYEIDPKAPSAAPKLIGDFDCIGATPDKAMLDLAVSQTGELWGISYANVYKLAIQGSVVHCAATIPLANPGNVVFFGLTFAPAGVLDPNNEVLVAGNTAGELWAIKTTDGTLTQHGTFGKVPANDGHGHSYQNQGKAWELSGDVVFLANKGSPVGFATVRDCPNPPDTTGCNTTDTLIEIDMTKLKSAGAQSVTLGVRGQIVKKSGCAGAATAYQQMLGIAAWDDKVYGFSHKGSVVEIDNTDGSACELADTPTIFWNGAGVTTLAPVIKPPN